MALNSLILLLLFILVLVVVVVVVTVQKGHIIGLWTIMYSRLGFWFSFLGGFRVPNV